MQPSKRTQRGFVLPSHTLIMAGVIVALSLSNVLFINLWQGAKDDHALYAAQVEAASESIRADNERKIREAAEATRQVEEQYADSRRRLAALGRTVRVQANRCEGTMPDISESTGQSDVATTEQGLDSAIVLTVKQCEERVENAVMDATQLLWLQQWVKEVSEIK